ncbi:DUF1499 domain-containing protein [Allorhizobium undicola]|uniref:DUF1499 domain-containing protein n=1 Tax=Allorhizobium undicola TaxID=78527 RepID=UPI000480C64B|nr:DUF1499 domain-containing protein [Allorhizobium undicola]
MTLRYVRPVSAAARLARRLSAFAVLMLLLGWLLYRFGTLQTPNFVALVLVAAALAALSVLLALAGLWRLWQVGAEGGVAALRALVLAALPLCVLAFAVLRYQDYPPLYEVASDPADAPDWIDTPLTAQKWLPRPPSRLAAQAGLQRAAYPELTVRRYDGALDRVYQVVMQVAAAQRLTITERRGLRHAQPELQLRNSLQAPAIIPVPSPRGVSPSAAEPLPAAPQKAPVPQPRPASAAAAIIPADVVNIQQPDDGEPEGVVRLQGVTRQRLLGLPFDLVIRLREEEETVLVDMRVASRFGPHDLGFSAAIAESFLDALDAELLGIAKNR